MPRTCTVCAHPERAEIDRALLSGEPLRNIAERVSLSATSLFRHKAHVSETLAKSHEATEVSRADALLGQLKHLTEDARRIQKKAEAVNDYRAALAGVRELTRLVELAARLSGDLAGQQTITLQEAATLFRGLTDAVHAHVHDPVVLRAISESFLKLTAKAAGQFALLPQRAQQTTNVARNEPRGQGIGE